MALAVERHLKAAARAAVIVPTALSENPSFEAVRADAVGREVGITPIEVAGSGRRARHAVAAVMNQPPGGRWPCAGQQDKDRCQE